MSRVIFALVLLVGLTRASAEDLTFPALTGRVVDDAGLIGASTERALTEQLAAHEAATGDQVVVVTLPSLQGRTIEDFGYQLGRHWGIGSAEDDDGLLLIVAPKERKVRIEVGYGLEGTMTDARARLIIENDILPAFRDGRMQGGIVDGTRAILDVLAGGDPPAAAADERDGMGEVWFFISVLIFIILAILAVHLGDRSSGGPYIPPGRDRRYRSGWGDTSGTGFGGGGFSGGGGGFSGGGGSFGGGGASGRW